MDALKDTIVDTKRYVLLDMKELYSSIKVDIARCQLLDKKNTSILAYTIALRKDVNFILLSLETSYHALIVSTHVVEKRFLIQNLWADLSESYKLLYGFGKAKSRSTWARIGNELQLINANDDSLHAPILKIHDALTRIIISIQPKQQDKEDRDLVYHYDKELLNVYERILRANDEEAVSEKIIEFLGLISCILQFCELIEQVEVYKGYHLPKVPLQDTFFFPLQKLFAEELSEHSKLQGVLNLILDGSDRIDSAARFRRSIVDLKSSLIKKMSSMDIPEVDNIDLITNADLLLNYMLLEGAAITRAYLRVKAEPSYPLMLRRITITRVSTLVHLYGYNEKERKTALWPRIVSIIPVAADVLLGEAERIETSLSGLINGSDKNDRKLYVHMVNNSTYRSMVPNIVERLEEMNPVLELQKMEALLNVASQVQRFLRKLMDYLAEQSHIRFETSKKKILAQLQDMRDMSMNVNCSIEIQTTIKSQIDFLERLVQDPLEALKEMNRS